jgi:hypothetical protein
MAVAGSTAVESDERLQGSVGVDVQAAYLL